MSRTRTDAEAELYQERSRLSPPSIRVPANVLWGLITLATGAASGYAGRAVVDPPKAPTVAGMSDEQVRADEQFKASVRELSAAVAGLATTVRDQGGAIANLQAERSGARLAALEVGQTLLNRNQLVTCRLTAKIAREPNPCREPAAWRGSGE